MIMHYILSLIDIRLKKFVIKPSILFFLFVLESYTIQDMCDKTVKTCFLRFILLLIDIRLDKCVTEEVLMPIYCPNGHKFKTKA